MDNVSELSNAIYRRIDWLDLKDTSLDFLCKIKEFLCNLFEEVKDQGSVEDSKARICEAVEKCCDKEEALETIDVTYNRIHQVLETDNIFKNKIISNLEKKVEKRNSQNQNLGRELNVEKVKTQKMRESHENAIEALKSKKEKENRELRAKNDHLDSAIARIEKNMLEKFEKVENLEKDNMNLRVKISSLEEEINIVKEGVVRLNRQSKSIARKQRFSEGLSFKTIFLSTFRENFRILRSQVMALASKKGFKQFLELGDRDTSTKLLIEEFLARYSISFENLKSLYRFYKKSNKMIIHEGWVVDAQSLKDISKCEYFMTFAELSTISEKIVQFMELRSSPCPSEKKFCVKCYKFSKHVAADCE